MFKMIGAYTLNELAKFFPIAEAISRLLHPFAEVVVHDLKGEQIAAIYNNFSKRNVGDASLIEEHEEFPEDNDIWGPYEKINWDGRCLKSITSKIRNTNNKLIGLLCINFDTSYLEKCQTLIHSFIGKTSDINRPEALFKNDWRERINQYINNYLVQNHLTISLLTLKQKRQLVHHLRRKGAFKGKNAANYIAHILNISRATVYNYLQKDTKSLNN